MAAVHLLLLKFKDDISSEIISEAKAQLLALKDNCLHPTTQMPYIRSLTSGKNNSPEGIQNGFTHAFTVEFDSTGDRDYYVKTDPAHKSFMALARTVIEKIIVFDYTPGQL